MTEFENEKQEQIYPEFPMSEIRKMKDHPFKVKKNDDDMRELMESIREHGVMTPIIVRPIADPYAPAGQEAKKVYEIVSGHRRFTACRLLEMKTIPTIVREMTNDEAILAMVDSNLQRERILPSEKAFAYKMKMEILSRQGQRNDLTSCQVGTKLRSDEIIAQNAGDSARQVQRYIRLTNLCAEMLDMVDDGKIALSPAFELSYLPLGAQKWLLRFMEENECTPSYSQAVKLHKMATANTLSAETMNEVMSVEKANQRETIKIPYEKLYQYFPRGYMPNDIVNAIFRMLEERKQQSAPSPVTPLARKSVTADIARIKEERENAKQTEQPAEPKKAEKAR